MLDDDLHEMVKSSFASDDCGITEQPAHSKEDVKAQKILESSTRKIDGRWETGLLWRDPGVILSESRSNAYRRLLLLERRFDKDRELLEKYEATIDGYIEKNYLRKATKKTMIVVGICLTSRYRILSSQVKFVSSLMLRLSHT